jgi:hypothetical protein
VRLTTPHNKKLFVTKVKQRKNWMDLTMMDRVGDRKQWKDPVRQAKAHSGAVVPVEEEEEVSLQLLSQTFLILGIIERDRSNMYIGRHVQYPSCAVPFMCSTLHVQYPSCAVPFMCSTLHVQYPSCAVPFMCSTLHVQYPSFYPIVMKL